MQCDRIFLIACSHDHYPPGRVLQSVKRHTVFASSTGTEMFLLSSSLVSVTLSHQCYGSNQPQMNYCSWALVINVAHDLFGYCLVFIASKAEQTRSAAGFECDLMFRSNVEESHISVITPMKPEDPSQLLDAGCAS